ncbi:AAEL009162-PA [Aedes aegypti]|uniref:AAEL009162-PA n=1 Tax=Aedes aegypti TaxID=7159 RepID=Q0IEN6_AEDAE|nr:AAEL009162-PA [Aedes aegypti]
MCTGRYLSPPSTKSRVSIFEALPDRRYAEFLHEPESHRREIMDMLIRWRTCRD